MIKYFLFDLDGTLLQMDMDLFQKIYFKGLTSAVKGISQQLTYESIWHGTKHMYANDGSQLNMDAFFKGFEEKSGIDFMTIIEDVKKYYAEKFDECSKACVINDNARKIIDILKSKGYQIVIATNPLFPKEATHARLRWIGLDPKEFLLVTTYENSHFTKPNPKYYEEICNKLNISYDECVMVGNDVYEDGAVKNLGIKLMLLNDNLLNTKNLPIEADFVGSIEEFIREISVSY